MTTLVNFISTEFANEVCREGCEMFRDKCITNIHTMSRNPISIPENKPLINPDIYKINKIRDGYWECLVDSPHAYVVNYGGVGTLTAKDYGLKAFPVGKSQGLPIKYSPTIKLQNPKPFATKSVEEVKQQLPSYVNISLQKGIKRIMR